MGRGDKDTEMDTAGLVVVITRSDAAKVSSSEDAKRRLFLALYSLRRGMVRALC